MKFLSQSGQLWHGREIGRPDRTVELKPAEPSLEALLANPFKISDEQRPIASANLLIRFFISRINRHKHPSNEIGSGP